MSENHERDSRHALVEESKETEEMAKKLHDYLKKDRKSVDRMRAVRLGIPSPLPPPPKNDDE